jgi:hypothetical protein
LLQRIGAGCDASSQFPSTAKAGLSGGQASASFLPDAKVIFQPLGRLVSGGDARNPPTSAVDVQKRSMHARQIGPHRR